MSGGEIIWLSSGLHFNHKRNNNIFFSFQMKFNNEFNESPKTTHYFFLSIATPGMKCTHLLISLFFIKLNLIWFINFCEFVYLFSFDCFANISWHWEIVCAIAGARFAYFANDFPWRILHFTLIFYVWQCFTCISLENFSAITILNWIRCFDTCLNWFREWLFCQFLYPQTHSMNRIYEFALVSLASESLAYTALHCKSNQLCTFVFRWMDQSKTHPNAIELGAKLFHAPNNSSLCQQKPFYSQISSGAVFVSIDFADCGL